MDSQPEWRLELSPGVMDAHYAPDGSIAAALGWVEQVLDGRLGEAWQATSPLFRLALTRYWCWHQRFELHQVGFDPLELAAALADDDGPAHLMWSAFAAGQQSPGSVTSAGWIAVGPPEPVAPDLEVVELMSAEAAGVAHRCPPLTLLLRLGSRGWQVAGHGRVPAKVGWPPSR